MIASFGDRGTEDLFHGRRSARVWHSIRVNDQWRLVFRWVDAGCHGVRLTDYH